MTTTNAKPAGGWKARFHAVLDAAVDAVIVIDEVGIVESVNQATVDLFGYRSHELVGHNVRKLMPEPYASSHDEYMKAYHDSGHARIIGIGREVEGKRKDGTIFPLRLAVGEGIEGDRRFFVGLLRDITENKQLEQALRLREEEVERILANAAVPTASTDLHGNLIRVNGACCRMLGYSATELEGRSILHLTHPDETESLRAAIADIVSGRRTEIQSEHRCMHRDGSVRYGTLHLAGIPDEHGAVEHVVAQVVDRTEQIRAEREARESLAKLAHVNRLSTLGEMAAGIAHEVNQPLGAISNYAQACRALLAKGTPEARLQEILEKISTQAQRAGDVIRRLRSLAGGQEVVHKPTRINELVREAVELGRTEARLGGIVIDLELDAKDPSASVDRVQIQQVTLNLLRNAVESMAECDADGPLDIHTRMRDNEISVAITDRGKGIAPEVADQLTQPFFSTKSTGMGVGLAICNSIVGAHGGRLWFHNNEDGPGATFGFTLPTLVCGERQARESAS